METNKSLRDILDETNIKIVKVLNDSQLAPEILELILSNLALQMHNATRKDEESEPETEN